MASVDFGDYRTLSHLHTDASDRIDRALTRCHFSPSSSTILRKEDDQLPDKRHDCHSYGSDTRMCNTCRPCFDSSSACLIKPAHHLLLTLFDELNMVQTSLALYNIFPVPLLTLILCFSWCETVNSIKGRLKAALFQTLISLLISITTQACYAAPADILYNSSITYGLFWLFVQYQQGVISSVW